jgi:hypothetical protein
MRQKLIALQAQALAAAASANALASSIEAMLVELKGLEEEKRREQAQERASCAEPACPKCGAPQSSWIRLETFGEKLGWLCKLCNTQF